MNIPINIETLLAGKVVESERIEYKKGWNPASIMRTVAAFANDFENLGSGYIVVGVEENNGLPKRPVHGFNPESFDKIQKEMIGYGNLMRPAYFPKMSLEEIDGRYVLLIWATAGSHRPYEVPKDVTSKKKEYEYFIRKFSNTVKANNDQRQELFTLTAKIPFDDRINPRTRPEEISSILIQNHLRAINSRLLSEVSNTNHNEICRQMNLAEGAEEHLYPKNVALLMFNENPEKFFPYTHIELVEFPKGVSGSEFFEKIFKGPIQQQLKDALAYIKTQVIKSKTVKIAGQAESVTYLNYPFEAIEEALANAVYHKNYELREPIEVRILPAAIEIISFGGPEPSIRIKDLNEGIVRSRRYRNRRIGEFLKELNMTEGKGTGMPTIKKVMEANGSPPAKYDTDGDERRFFVTELPVHPHFLTEAELQDKLQDKIADGAHDGALTGQVTPEVAPEVTPEVMNMLAVIDGQLSRREIMGRLNLADEKHFRENYQQKAVSLGLIEMTIP
ncbi:MAG: RNA-binding domain-containing protein, partial [Candidatus Delongbacteria bacterium]